jgi:hypothetical protein
MVGLACKKTAAHQQFISPAVKQQVSKGNNFAPDTIIGSIVRKNGIAPQ